MNDERVFTGLDIMYYTGGKSAPEFFIKAQEGILVEASGEILIEFQVEKEGALIAGIEVEIA